ncbi:MAG: lytic transglycosylase domain-containing protein [Sphingomicrobium sp.]
MKSPLLGLAILAPFASWSQPLLARQADPLAPLATAPSAPARVPRPPTVVVHRPLQQLQPRLQPQLQTQPGMPVIAQPLFQQPVAPLVRPIVIPRDWRGVFDAIDAGNWASAQAGIATLPPGVLTPVAKAELYTARGSPAVDLATLQALIAEAPDLPQAAQLAAMAIARGATTAPLIRAERPTVVLGFAPVRYRARPILGEPAADQLRPVLDALVKADDAAGAESALLVAAPSLPVEARAEAGQRVAFVYYVLGRDADARRVADTWRQGAASEWASQAAWLSALASWRLNDFNAASYAFQQAAAGTQQTELRAGAYYWAARSEQAAGRPQSVERLMRIAAASRESFYGLVARETLGMATRLSADPLAASDPTVDQVPNVRRAAELARIGESALAEKMLRHQAMICNPAEHHALIQSAKRFDLPAAQLWLANHGQPGARSDPSDRYPNPSWAPLNGWRVDPALAFGHIVQESSFRRTAVSSAGAVGLMQVLPITAQQVSQYRGIPYSRATLTDPRFNLEYGQTFLETMRQSSGTGGQLPRVIASYNAGPSPVSRWAAINDHGDPLLWIESIPYWETRYYVPAVMRNMWVYQGLNHERTSSLTDLAQHRWPAFPTRLTNLQH